MNGRRRHIPGIIAATGGIVLSAAVAGAMDEAELPAGPIRDRHQLMEDIGAQAQIVGGAMKSGDFAPVAPAGERMQALAAKIPSLFPEGSTHPKSRARETIWADWDRFVASAAALEQAAGKLAATVKVGGDVRAAGAEVFATCKGCHTDFRLPDD